MSAPLMLTAPPTKVVLCSYAYDIPSYYDFVVKVPAHLTEAEAEAEAERIAQEALEESDSVFDDKVGNECVDNESNHRVFVSGVAKTPVEWEHNPELVMLAEAPDEGYTPEQLKTKKPRFELREP